MKYLYSLLVGSAAAVLVYGLVIGSIHFGTIAALVLLAAAFVLSPVISKKKDKRLAIGISAAALVVGNILAIIAFRNNLYISYYSYICIFALAANVFGIIRARTSEPTILFGIRNRYSIEYSEVWEKTHDFYSVLSVVFIPLELYLCFLFSGKIMLLALILLCLAVPVISTCYSIIIGRRYEKEVSDK